MALEKVSRKMVLEIKYVNANNAVIHVHTENSKLLLDSKLTWELGFGPNLGWELGFGIPLHDPPTSPLPTPNSKISFHVS